MNVQPGQIVKRGLAGAAAAAVVLGFVYRSEITQLYRVAHLFDADRIVYNFQHMNELFPTRSVATGSRVFEFRRGSYRLPESFFYQGRSYRTEEFLEETATEGLVIVHDDAIVFEQYWLGHSARVPHIAWSVSKSFMSALFGIAVAEGHIPDIMAPVTDYLPELAGSGYDGVPIKHVLQMSSGVGFDENYGDPASDINRMGRAMAMGTPMLDFAATLERVRPPGTFHHYVSVDTQVLGTVLVRATGRSLSELTREKLWEPLGMESEAYWMVDDTGMEMAFGGFNATLRDFARFGRLYLHRGSWNGVQIVEQAWVDASVTPDAPHLMPGANPNSSVDMGYGYQWWIPQEPDGDFMALGVYNQMIYVDPKRELVIARHAANRDFERDDFEPTREALALWRTIAAELSRSRSSKSVGVAAAPGLRELARLVP